MQSSCESRASLVEVWRCSAPGAEWLPCQSRLPVTTLIPTRSDAIIDCLLLGLDLWTQILTTPQALKQACLGVAWWVVVRDTSKSPSTRFSRSRASPSGTRPTIWTARMRAYSRDTHS